MARRKKGSCSDILIGSAQFNVLGCGRYSGGDFYVYNDSEVLGLPYNVLLRKYFYYSEISEGADTKSCSLPAPAEALTFTLANKSGKTHSFSQEWPLFKSSVHELSLLYAWGGDPVPESVKGTKNTDYQAVKKQHGKDSWKIDSDKIVDICTYAIDTVIEDERQMLIADFRSDGVLGYLLGEITMLVDLQQSDFEVVFDAGLQPIAVVYDERASRHEVVFKDGSKPDEIQVSGRVRFLRTPKPFVGVYHGEIRKRIGLQSIIDPELDRPAAQDNSAGASEEPNIPEKDTSEEVQTEIHKDKMTEESDPGASAKKRTTLREKHSLEAQMKYWAFIYACKIAIEEKSKPDRKADEPLFRTQEKLIKVANCKLQEVLKIENFTMEIPSLKAHIKKAVIDRDLPDIATGKLKSED
jgi:hypothetical protein